MSLTNTLYKLARASATARSLQSPSKAIKRQVRRRVYRKEGALTRAVLRAFKL